MRQGVRQHMQSRRMLTSITFRIAASPTSCDVTRNLRPPLRLQTLSLIEQSCPTCAVRQNCDGFVDVPLGPLDTRAQCTGTGNSSRDRLGFVEESQIECDLAE